MPQTMDEYINSLTARHYLKKGEFEDKVIKAYNYYMVEPAKLSLIDLASNIKGYKKKEQRLKAFKNPINPFMINLKNDIEKKIKANMEKYKEIHEKEKLKSQQAENRREYEEEGEDPEEPLVDDELKSKLTEINKKYNDAITRVTKIKKNKHEMAAQAETREILKASGEYTEKELDDIDVENEKDEKADLIKKINDNREHEIKEIIKKYEKEFQEEYQKKELEFKKKMEPFIKPKEEIKPEIKYMEKKPQEKSFFDIPEMRQKPVYPVTSTPEGLIKAEEISKQYNIKLPEATWADWAKNHLNTLGELTHLSTTKYNYLGPGTYVKFNIENGVKPYNMLDKLAYFHDLDYIKAGTIKDEHKKKIKEQEIDDQFMKDLVELKSRLSKQGHLVGFEETAEQKKERENQISDTLVAIDMMNAKERYGFSFIGETERLVEPEFVEKVEKMVEPEYVKKVKPIYKIQQMIESGGMVASTQPVTTSTETKTGNVVIGAPPPPLALPAPAPVVTAKAAIGTPPPAPAIGNGGTPPPIVHHVKRPGRFKVKKIQIAGMGQLTQDVSKLTEEEQKAKDKLDENVKGFVKLDAVRYTDKVVTGERSMRASVDKRLGADYVKLTPEEKERNIAFYSNLNFVKEGNGNGNQQLLPFSYKGWKAKNKLFDVSKLEEKLRFSGKLNVGNQYVQPRAEPTFQMRQMKEPLMSPQDQVRQRLFPVNPYAECSVGKPIMMSNERQNDFNYSSGSNYAKNSTLYFQNYVNNGFKL